MPRGRVRQQPAATTPSRTAPRRRATPKVAPTPTPTPIAAPEPFTGPVHPYYVETDGRGAFFVVRTLHGQAPSRVAGPFKVPRAAIDRALALNEKASDELST
jgi:hypothetical protein